MVEPLKDRAEFDRLQLAWRNLETEVRSLKDQI